MLFIYPNVPKTTNENVLCSVLHDFLSLWDTDTHTLVLSFLADSKKKNDTKHIHVSVSEAYRAFLVCLYLVFSCCVYHAGRAFFFFIYLFMFYPSFKFIIRLSSLCKSLLVFLLVMYVHPLYNGQKRKKKTQRNVMRCAENWMQKNIWTTKKKRDFLGTWLSKRNRSFRCWRSFLSLSFRILAFLCVSWNCIFGFQCQSRS